MTLYDLNEERIKLFERYEKREITKSEYLKLVRPLDEAVDKMEMRYIKSTGVSGKEFSEPSEKS